MSSQDTTPPDSPQDHSRAELDEASSATLDALEDVLDAVREAHPDTPQWEFCEGALTALLCTRRAVPQAEWLPFIFGRDAGNIFANPAQETTFLMGWQEREAQLRAALEAPVDSLEDEGALAPAVMDWRGLLASLPEPDRAEAAADQDGPPPALAQVWAQGFMAAVDRWSDDWAPPRDKEIAESMGDALACVDDLLDDDTAQPALNLYEPDAAPSVSEARFEAFGEALWAVYDLYAIAKSLGPRTGPIRNDDKVGRNDLCPCGSGKKYKKCHGA